MVKKLLLGTMVLFVFTQANSQNQNKIRCSVNHHEHQLQQQNPNRIEERKSYDAALQKWMQKNVSQASRSAITIPVVVHILHKATAENISDAQVNSQIVSLNEDFTRTNSDASSTPSAFLNVAGNPNIEFCLAQIDPNGNPTSGIVRKPTTSSTFSDDDKVKFSNQGGDDAWPTTQYFNIWVCNLGQDLLGYGEFPTSQATNTFGLVVNYTCFGTTGTAQAPFNKGRTSTHEVGHCFNLFHIWGDEPSCAEDDMVSDTPLQKGENYGCPSYPQTTQSGGRCNSSDPSSMFMNYMDYSDDACMNMFSAGQAQRMLAVLNNAPYNALQNSNKCSSSPAQADDAGISAVSSPSGSSCSLVVNPVVTLRNAGSNELTSVTINYKVDNGSISSYNWVGNLAALGTTNVNIPAITVSAGNHSFYAYTSNPNGNVDANSSNDQSSSNFTIISEGKNLPFSYGFEPSTFAPADWSLNNEDGLITWARTTTAAHSGTASAFINNYDYDVNGQVDELMLPGLNLSGVTSPTMSFYVAYQLYTDPNSPDYVSSDSLEVLVSEDCGVTWLSVYNKAGSDLVTAQPAFSTSKFVPNASQWRKETINLSSFSSSTNAIVKFKHISNYENDLFIDDVNVDALTSIAQSSNNFEVFLYPNPAKDYVLFNFGSLVHEQIALQILDLSGKVIIAVDNVSEDSPVDISSLSNGLYIYQCRAINGQTMMGKFVKQQ